MIICDTFATIGASLRTDGGQRDGQIDEEVEVIISIKMIAFYYDSFLHFLHTQKNQSKSMMQLNSSSCHRLITIEQD